MFCNKMPWFVCDRSQDIQADSGRVRRRAVFDAQGDDDQDADSSSDDDDEDENYDSGDSLDMEKQDEQKNKKMKLVRFSFC